MERCFLKIMTDKGVNNVRRHRVCNWIMDNICDTFEHLNIIHCSRYIFTVNLYRWVEDSDLHDLESKMLAYLYRWVC